MINKQDVISYFNQCASSWDAEMIRSDEKINRILDIAKVQEGSYVLDVACGTGVLFPDYLQRKVSSVIGVDISPEMAKRATEKSKAEPKIQVICGDVTELIFSQTFDAIVIYNAFPHFVNPGQLISHLSSLLSLGGTLTIAHSMSRATLDKHHSGSAQHVSTSLMHEDELEALMQPYLDVYTKISNDEMYVVAGKKGSSQ